MENIISEFINIESSIDGLYREAAVKLCITDTELRIFYVILIEGSGCNQSSLYKKTGITRSTVNPALHQMMKKGLIELQKGDGRNVRVLLTDSGKELADNTAGRILAIENEIFARWTEKERERFLSFNRRYMTEFAERVKEL